MSNLKQPDLISTVRVNSLWHANSVRHLCRSPRLCSRTEECCAFATNLELLIRSLEAKPELRARVKDLSLIASDMTGGVELRMTPPKTSIKILTLVEDLDTLEIDGASCCGS